MSPSSAIQRWAARAPWLIVLYFAVQLFIRLLLSPNLEVDDAEMVGQVNWAWGYANSHPPLYSWLVRLAFEATHNWVAATSGPKYALLAGGYLLTIDAVRRAGGSRVAAALSAVALLLMPVVVWKTQGKLSHSVIGFFATAATVHASALVMQRGRWRDFAWLGVAVSIGVLSKYNYLLVLAGLVVAVAALPQARRAFCKPRALLSIALVAVLTGPHLWWLRSHFGEATERLYMLQQPQDALPHGGALPFDGLLSLLIALLVSIGPALLAWVLAGRLLGQAKTAAPADRSLSRALPRKRESRSFEEASEPDTTAGADRDNAWTPASAKAGVLSGRTSREGVEDGAALRRLASVIFAVSVGAFAVAALVGGFHKVHERYLLALLPAFAAWLPLAWRLDLRPRAAGALLALGAVVALGVTIARPVLAHTTDTRLAWPYAPFANQLLPVVPQNAVVVGDRPENSANLAMNLPGASVWDGTDRPAALLAAADDAAGLGRIEQGLGRDYAGGPRVILCGRLMNGATKRVCLTTEVLAHRQAVVP